MQRTKYNVFISYHTGTCKEIAELIASELCEHGITAFIAARDISHDDYATQIYDAIQNCDAFLLLLNYEASHSAHVKNEINLMTDRMCSHDRFARFILQLSKREELDGATLYYVGRMHWNDGMTPPLNERIREFSARIVDTLQHREPYEYSDSPQKPLLVSTSVPQNLNFVGREALMNDIHELLAKHGKLFLEGFGGIGKSEAVRQYIRRFKHEYGDGVFFVTYKGNLLSTLVDDSQDGIRIPELHRPMGESDEDYYRRKLECLRETVTGRMLIAIDNFDVESDDRIQDLLSLNCRVIFTTRMDHRRTGQAVLKLEALENDEQIALMQKYCRLIQTDEDKEAARRIADLVHGHTLTIILISELMQRMHKRPKDMLVLLWEQGLSTVLENHTLVHNDSSSAFDRVKKIFNLYSLSEKERYIMANMALMPIEGVGFDLFMRLCDLEDGTEIDDLINCSWLTYDDLEAAASP